MLVNSRNKKELAQRLLVADTFLPRLKGLMGKRAMSPGEALLLEPCNAIHTLFMNFAIDVAFLDRESVVLKLITNLPPWRIALPVSGAYKVLELPAGILEMTNTVKGDQLMIQDKG